ncbi:MAG: NfeD family protein [Ahniella sp.]|nr:NfeD family protein [Ahniella sp.]
MTCPLLNRRGEQLVGRVFVVEEAIVRGQGKVKVGDTLWVVQGEDCAPGAQVRVIDIMDSVLRVEPI